MHVEQDAARENDGGGKDGSEDREHTPLGQQGGPTVDERGTSHPEEGSGFPRGESENGVDDGVDQRRTEKAAQ